MLKVVFAGVSVFVLCCSGCSPQTTPLDGAVLDSASDGLRDTAVSLETSINDAALAGDSEVSDAALASDTTSGDAIAQPDTVSVVDAATSDGDASVDGDMSVDGGGDTGFAVPMCPPGTHGCNGICTSDESVLSCGSRCSPCDVPANAYGADCQAGACAISSCRPGFAISTGGTSCENINECMVSNGGCSVFATCTDTVGSNRCTCLEGYTGNGVLCTPVSTAGTTIEPMFGSPSFASTLALSADGNVLLVADPRGDSGVGEVSVYRYGSAGWVFDGFVPRPSEWVSFGGVLDISSDGQVIVVGGVTYERRRTDWVARVYRLVANRWETVHTTYPYNDRIRVALSGDGGTLAVGTHDGYRGGINIYRQSESSWAVSNLIPNSGWLSSSVAISEDGNAVASGLGTLQVADPGGLIVFGHRGTAWQESTRVLGTRAYSRRGSSVTMSGDATVIATRGETDGIEIFSTGDALARTALLERARNGSGSFGDNMVLSQNGNTLLVGDHQGGGDSRGAAHFYSRIDGDWTAPQALERPTTVSAFGAAIAMSSDGRVIVVGDPTVAVGPSRTGRVIVYRR